MIIRIKRVLIYILLSVFMLSNIPNNIYAASQVITDSKEELKPYAEEVGWFTRYVDGKKQKRLWSYTYGRWITDWMWV